jgi:hypothetical protein
LSSRQGPVRTADIFRTAAPAAGAALAVVAGLSLLERSLLVSRRLPGLVISLILTVG